MSQPFGNGLNQSQFSQFAPNPFSNASKTLPNQRSTNQFAPNSAFNNFPVKSAFQTSPANAPQPSKVVSAFSSGSAFNKSNQSTVNAPQSTYINSAFDRQKESRKESRKEQKKEQKKNKDKTKKTQNLTSVNYFQPAQSNYVEPNPDQRELKRARLKAKLKAGRLEQPPAYPQFAPVNYTQMPGAHWSNDSTVLNTLPKPLTNMDEVVDSFDAANQQKLNGIEQRYLTGQIPLQSAYDEMNEMRDRERTEMEKRKLVDNSDIRKNLDDAIVFIGSCKQMCPVFERVRRAHENNVLSVEKNAHGQVNPDLAVKAFSRPAAGQPPPLPSDVRPPKVLVQTLEYLVSSIVPQLPHVHPFLWDRTRSIRQDFTYQNYQGPEAVHCFEVIARIHIVCLHVMAQAHTEHGVEWSQQQELEQFTKCLQSLADFYTFLPSQNEAEMRAYQLLVQLFDPEMASAVDRLDVREHPLVVLAFELRQLANLSPLAFFSRLRQPDVPVTFRVIAEIHFNALRKQAFRLIASGAHYRTQMYEMSRFVPMLGFESIDEARSFCQYYDVLVNVSDEAGEGVDLRTWSETNVEDKMPMAQGYDKSITDRVRAFNVAQSVQISHTGFNNAQKVQIPFNASTTASTIVSTLSNPIKTLASQAITNNLNRFPVSLPPNAHTTPLFTPPASVPASKPLAIPTPLNTGANPLFSLPILPTNPVVSQPQSQQPVTQSSQRFQLPSPAQITANKLPASIPSLVVTPVPAKVSAPVLAPLPSIHPVPVEPTVTIEDRTKQRNKFVSEVSDIITRSLVQTIAMQVCGQVYEKAQLDLRTKRETEAQESRNKERAEKLEKSRGRAVQDELRNIRDSFQQVNLERRAQSEEMISYETESSGASSESASEGDDRIELADLLPTLLEVYNRGLMGMQVCTAPTKESQLQMPSKIHLTGDKCFHWGLSRNVALIEPGAKSSAPVQYQLHDYSLPSVITAIKSLASKYARWKTSRLMQTLPAKRMRPDSAGSSPAPSSNASMMSVDESDSRMSFISTDEQLLKPLVRKLVKDTKHT